MYDPANHPGCAPTCTFLALIQLHLRGFGVYEHIGLYQQHFGCMALYHQLRQMLLIHL